MEHFEDSACPSSPRNPHCVLTNSPRYNDLGSPVSRTQATARSLPTWWHVRRLAYRLLIPSLTVILALCHFATAQSGPAAAGAEQAPPTSPTLIQLNDALQQLAAKVSAGVVQVLVTGYGPLVALGRATVSGFRNGLKGRDSPRCHEDTEQERELRSTEPSARCILVRSGGFAVKFQPDSITFCDSVSLW